MRIANNLHHFANRQWDLCDARARTQQNEAHILYSLETTKLFNGNIAVLQLPDRHDTVDVMIIHMREWNGNYL